MNIIIDSAEKMPWSFEIYPCTVERGNLQTGDYTLKGYENLLAVERKRNTGEISINLGLKWRTFHEEFERMSEFKYKYLICEFSLDDLIAFPDRSGIPKKTWPKIRTNGRFLISKLTKECDKYGIELLFCGNRQEAITTTMGIFREVIHEETKS
jgi:hypothetical protein